MTIQLSINVRRPLVWR